MTTHEKALEAAIDACVADLPNGGAEIDIHRAITAYLSALLPQDAAGLVDRLQKRALAMRSVLKQTAATKYDADLSDEAASLIQSQAARIAELEAGLDEAKETLYWASRRMKGNCAGADVSAVTLSAHRARALLNKEASHD